MGVSYCLSTLESTVKLLSSISFKTTEMKAERLAKFGAFDSDPVNFRTKLEMLPDLCEESIKLDETSLKLETLLADVATVTVLVQKYLLVAAGIPLAFEGIDMYTSTPEDQEDAITSTFMFTTATATGLVSIMEETVRNKDVTDAEVFSTFRAIGCQSFTAFEASVHRAVDHVADKVWEMAVELETDQEKERKKNMNEQKKKKQQQKKIKQTDIDEDCTLC